MEMLVHPTRSDLKLLERMILNLMAAQQALADAQREPMVIGSTGQLVENSQFKVAARCDGVAISMARQLCLTPATGGGEVDQGDDDPFSSLDGEAKGRTKT